MKKNQFFTSIYVVRTDNALEYVKHDVPIFCSKNGIIHQTSCSHTSRSHTSQQNEIAKRKHKHILDVARTIMFHMHVLKYLWSETVLSACHLINKMPSSILGEKIPFSCLHPHKSVFFMTPWVFDCTYFVKDYLLG